VAYTVPTREPEVIFQGETAEWKRAGTTDFPTGSGWTLKYYAAGNGLTAWNVTCTEDGSDYHATISATSTASMSIGTFDVQAVIQNGAGTTKYPIWTGKIRVAPSIVSPSSYDSRTWAKKTLDAIEAALLAFASGTTKSATIEGVTYTREAIPDLLALRDRVRTEYQAELAAERVANGLPSRKKILVRFGIPSV
jgi:hypothetical protein